jgi:RNA polymerase sigma-70 factor, ECF subfamily
MASWPWSRPAEPNRRAEAEDLLRDHADELYRAAYRFTRNRDDAEDLAQDVVVRALSRFQLFEPGTNFRAWILRMMTNLYISEYRRRRQVCIVSLGDEQNDLLEEIPDDCCLETKLFDEALDEEIEHALESLGETVRLTVLLVDVEGLTYDEVAGALGVPIGTVRSRLNRGREQLRRALSRHAGSRAGV